MVERNKAHLSISFMDRFHTAETRKQQKTKKMDQEKKKRYQKVHM